MSGPIKDEIFLNARRATARNAFTKFQDSLGIDKKNKDAVLSAARQFSELRLLNNNPDLYSLSYEALASARGHHCTGTDKFPATIWMFGAENTHGGRAFLGTIADFATKLLVYRAQQIANKRDGWVIEPTTNPEGRRTNEKTLAMHALFLDCDGTGNWDRILEVLRELGFAFVAYQSGGWTPTTPKWRLVFLLDTPFDTSTDSKQLAWKIIYNHVRTVVGAIAGLSSIGFDPATETPCTPWFMTEKRDPNDSQRTIIWQPGHTLDLSALALALPDWEEEVVLVGDHVDVEKLTLTEERFEEIVDALTTATLCVPSGRRDLYLSLSGALLDRGITPDDTLSIITEVSLRYPNAALHPEKHMDNVHNAMTTISRRAVDGRVTRIRTLNDQFPDVAQALDETVPNAAAMMSQTMNDMLQPVASIAPPVPAAVSLLDTVPAPVREPIIVKKRKMKRGVLAKKVGTISRRLLKNKVADRRLEGTLMKFVLDGESIPTNLAEGIDLLVYRLTSAMGYNLPATNTWQETLDLIGPSLMTSGFTQSIERVATAERAFYEGRGKKNKATMKRAAKKLAERLKLAASTHPRAI